jgi:hypothetical protein
MAVPILSFQGPPLFHLKCPTTLTSPIRMLSLPNWVWSPLFNIISATRLKRKLNLSDSSMIMEYLRFQKMHYWPCLSRNVNIFYKNVEFFSTIRQFLLLNSYRPMNLIKEKTMIRTDWQTVFFLAWPKTNCLVSYRPCLGFLIIRTIFSFGSIKNMRKLSKNILVHRKTSANRRQFRKGRLLNR